MDGGGEDLIAEGGDERGRELSEVGSWEKGEGREDDVS
jgi:hypothetical protein